jgi:hypothetical protein
MTTTNFTAGDDIIDVREIIARVEELREERDDVNQEFEDAKGSQSAALIEAAEDVLVTYLNSDNHNELTTLESLLSDLCGNAGDEQWEGDWYPVTLIHENYFESYMDDMLEDIGDIPKDLPSYLTITVDYDALKQDYQECEFDGQTYYYR